MLSTSNCKNKTGALSLRLRSVSLMLDNRSRPVVSSIDFDLDAGKTLALIGESGAGKTSVALAVMGLWPGKLNGQIFLGDKELTSLGQKQWRDLRGKRLALLMQDPMTALNPVFTIGRQLRDILKFRRGLTKRRADEEMLFRLGRAGLKPAEETARAYVHQLSGGMAQRAALSIALAAEPGILIADEPFSALDPETAADQTALLRREQKSGGFSLLLITHDLRLASDLADSAVILKDGSIVESGPAAKLFAAPQTDYGVALLEHTYFAKETLASEE